MAVALASFQNTTSDGTALVLTKPVSLAVGDLLVAGIFVANQANNTSSLNTPSGWTLEEDVEANTQFELAVYLKTATSGDVAASDFTFASTNNGGYHMSGFLARVTDPGIVAGESSAANVGTENVVLSTFTPTRSNTLFLAFAASADTSTPSISGIALTTNNPTWTTEATQTRADSSFNTRTSFFSASRAEATATGDITITTSEAGGFLRNHGIVISLSSSVSGSVTPTTKVNSYAYNPINPTANLDIFVNEPTDRITTPAVWTPETKPSTTWINEQK